MSNELSPRQRELLARLIGSELAALRDAAVTAGATPEAVAGVADRRRRALDPEPADAPGHTGDEGEPTGTGHDAGHLAGLDGGRVVAAVR